MGGGGKGGGFGGPFGFAKENLNCFVGLIRVAPSVFSFFQLLLLSCFLLRSVSVVLFCSVDSYVRNGRRGRGRGSASAGDFLFLHDVVVEAAAGVVLVAWQESSRS